MHLLRYAGLAIDDIPNAGTIHGNVRFSIARVISRYEGIEPGNSEILHRHFFVGALSNEPAVFSRPKHGEVSEPVAVVIGLDRDVAQSAPSMDDGIVLVVIV